MRRILVLRGGALGDFIVSLPALAALRNRWPAARIELVGNAAAAALALPRELLDAVHSQHEARWSALFNSVPLPAEFAAWLAEFDLVINYWPDSDGALLRHFPLRDGQTFLTADALPSRGPAAAHYAAPLRELGIESVAPFFALAPVAARVSAGTVPPPARRTLYVHPGSGSARKNWPMENWLTLIPQLRAPVTVILGEAELPRWSALSLTRFQGASAPSSQRLGDKPLHLLKQPPLEDLVAHFSTCALFLGHDSGISHLAAACGARCVILFGPTDPAVWAPPAPHVQVLRPGHELSAISVAAVRLAAETALAGRT